jgi:hypothetical protein
LRWSQTGVWQPTSTITIASSGNVGIGTTSPAQKLHVEGNCVTEDTLITIFEQGLQAPGSRLQTAGSRFKEKRIVEVKPGDYVLSLNEEKGRLEPHRVRALLDMGIKPVFKLTTADGRSIKTTGNHPYLAIQTNEQQTIQFRTIEGLAKQYGLSPEDLSEDKEFSQIRALWIDQSIKESSNLNSTQHSGRQGQVFSERIYPISLFSQRQSLRDGNLFEIGSQTQLPSRKGNQGNSQSGLYYPEPAQWSHSLTQAKWTKVIDLKEGDLIAVLNLEPRAQSPEQVLWARIEKIEFVGYEHVYDLAIEGTHNFIANGILAHNTYISGNVGIGTTAPNAKLEVLSTGTQTRLSYSGSVYANLYVDSAGNLQISTYPTGKDIQINDNNLRVCAGGSCPTPSYSGTGNLQVEGRVQINAPAGTAPLIVQSNTLVTNLNADLLDGYHASNLTSLACTTISCSNIAYDNCSCTANCPSGYIIVYGLMTSGTDETCGDTTGFHAGQCWVGYCTTGGSSCTVSYGYMGNVNYCAVVASCCKVGP